ncbi:MAG: DUF2147 domain-containing protein, partial [Pseudomonadota bacterium]|nr:DUF2147 domain-containing protein [Pseudomonadota bacterium]
MNRMLIGILASGLLGLSSVSVMAAADPDQITGYWRSIDDETGFAKAIVRIQKANNDTYLATVVETIERPNYKAAEFCVDCPAPFTNRKIVDMPVVWNVKADPKRDLHYIHGYVIDPLSGRIYAADIKLSPDNRRLTLRGKV